VLLQLVFYQHKAAHHTKSGFAEPSTLRSKANPAVMNAHLMVVLLPHAPGMVRSDIANHCKQAGRQNKVTLHLLSCICKRNASAH
jgi:hypothetical protein